MHSHAPGSKHRESTDSLAHISLSRFGFSFNSRASYSSGQKNPAQCCGHCNIISTPNVSLNPGPVNAALFESCTKLSLPVTWLLRDRDGGLSALCGQMDVLVPYVERALHTSTTNPAFEGGMKVALFVCGCEDRGATLGCVSPARGALVQHVTTRR